MGTILQSMEAMLLMNFFPILLPQVIKMLLPAKHIKLSESIIALGAFILDFLKEPKSVDKLWLETKQISSSLALASNHSYDNFLLSIDYLYAIGAININSKEELFLCN